MHRRDFFVHSSAMALGMAVPRFGARRGNGADLAALIEQLKRQVPMWMQELAVPGVGIAVIHDAAIAWRGSFGDATQAFLSA